ncbi:MAG: 30S ribosomal protein S6 [Candidatus Paraimprobicoccus trichonymphae]|uniref:Small ribosomal subunit protein bS6 n=1 Tax=Candidatus Paraimprobicoccus trichonymphae TaxID=3033793 RepID=A0AA48I481_9FIRM|nr:MAG: 30S ribosomal protein S6 [Candidatus Paraimprobicoccus trichonymphae]
MLKITTLKKNSYEFLLVVSYKISEEFIEELINKFKKLIEKNAEFENVDRWGKRRLAYLINKEIDGYYVLFNFKSVPDFPEEISRISEITDNILRYIIIKKSNEIIYKKEGQVN